MMTIAIEIITNNGNGRYLCTHKEGIHEINIIKTKIEK